MKISFLLSPIRKHAPEVITPFFDDYITRCEIPGDTTYNYGYGSLKWVIFRIAEIDPDRATLMLFTIMAETVARNIDQQTIERHCYRLFCLRKYRPSLRDTEQIDVMQLTGISIGTLKVVINDTGRSLTGLILRKRPETNIIVSVCEGTPSVISFRKPYQDLRALAPPNITDIIIDELGKFEGGWTMLESSNGSLTFINHTPAMPGYAHIIAALRKARYR